MEWRNTETKRTLDNIVRHEISERNKLKDASEAVVNAFLGPITHDYCFDPSTVDFFGRSLARVKQLEARLNRISKSGVTDEDVAETQRRITAARALIETGGGDTQKFIEWLENDLKRRRTETIPAAVAALDQEIEKNIQLREERRRLSQGKVPT